MASDNSLARRIMKNTLGSSLLLIAWLVALSVGFTALWRHAQTPGVAARAQNDWPARSRLPRDAGRATLIVFAHPQCPCTQATLHELQRVLTSEGDRVTCYMLFERLAGTAANWTQTPLRRAAEGVVGLKVREDNGREAQLFGARTSGQVVLYDAEGRLRYAGGLTESRGHEGDNSGEDAILALLAGKRRSLVVVRAPVFGCSFR